MPATSAAVLAPALAFMVLAMAASSDWEKSRPMRRWAGFSPVAEPAASRMAWMSSGV